MTRAAGTDGATRSGDGVAARGRYFEDFRVGDVHRHPRGRTISEADNTWFTLLTLNTNQLHFNRDYATAMPLGEILVNSGFTLALVLGLTVEDISEHAIANLGWDEIRLRHPVHVGDTLYAQSRIVAVRPSRSRPEAGIVTVRTRGLNQHGDVVLSFRRSILLPTRAGHAGYANFPTTEEPWEEEVAG